MRYQVLASDYDGTIAEHGVVGPYTVAALRRFREAGGELVLVTGREVQDLQAIFPELDVFHWIVGENGAVLHEVATGELTLLAAPPAPGFLAKLKARGVAPLYIGHVIVATFDEHMQTIENVISEGKLDLQVSLNKGAVMILPRGCDKASGLSAFLAKTGRSREQTVGVGDAENDLPLLAAAGLGVALSNALPVLKEQAGWVMSKPSGEGVAELIERLLEGVAEDPIQQPR